MLKTIKENKWRFLVSSIAILLPILVGVIFWEKLPQMMTTHWGADGVADGSSNRVFAIVGLPVILLIGHWLCVLITLRDPKNKEQSSKIVGITFWIMPVISWFSNAIVYAAAFGKEFDVDAAPLIMVGLMFVVFGNYMPKCKQNSTVGVKVKWALADEENWNATHRFAGKVWVIGGLFIMACALLPLDAFAGVIVTVIMATAVGPMIYSYLYYKKQAAEGKVPEKAVVPMTRWQRIFSTVMVTVIVVGVVIVMFTGNVKVHYGETSFTIDAMYWDDLTVDYDAVDSIEYAEDFDAGVRTNGWGSARLCLGIFENDAFGAYTLYAYTNGDGAVVMQSGEDVLVIVGKDEAETKGIYEELANRVK